eukprot:12224886-Karenia_brevis.AAC.1
MRATNVDSHSLRKHDMHDGKQRAGHDGPSSNVNEASQSITPSVVVGERVASQVLPPELQTRAVFSKVS